MGNDRPNVVIGVAKCPATKNLYGVRIEITEPKKWNATWAFPIKPEVAKREGYKENEFPSDIVYTSGYPGCPYCKKHEDLHKISKPEVKAKPIKIAVTSRGCDDIGSILSSMKIKYFDYSSAGFNCDLLFLNCLTSDRIDSSRLRKFVSDGGNGVSVPVCWAGGISATGNVNVTACAAVCDIAVRGAGTHYVGGLAGGITGTMLNSYHIGNVKVESESSIICGGVVGVLQDISYYGGDKSKVNIAIKNCYNSGAVYIHLAEETHVPTSNFLAGGVVGFNMIEGNEIKGNYFDSTAVENFTAPQGFIASKYWYGEEVPGQAENVEGANISGNGGLTEEELKSGPIEGFDGEIWKFENGSYPKLYWE